MTLGYYIGHSLDGDDAVRILETFLKRWLYTYLASMAEDKGLDRDYFAVPRYWETTSTSARANSDRYPAIRVLSTGTDGPPTVEGDGTVRETFIVGVAALVSAKDQEATNSMARSYGATIRNAVLQNKGLESSHVHGCSLQAQFYDDDLPTGEDDRTLASCRLVFAIELRGVTNTRLGPGPDLDPLPDPPNDEYPDPEQVPDAEHVIVTVDNTINDDE